MNGLVLRCFAALSMTRMLDDRVAASWDYRMPGLQHHGIASKKEKTCQGLHRSSQPGNRCLDWLVQVLPVYFRYCLWTQCRGHSLKSSFFLAMIVDPWLRKENAGYRVPRCYWRLAVGVFLNQVVESEQNLSWCPYHVVELAAAGLQHE